MWLVALNNYVFLSNRTRTRALRKYTRATTDKHQQQQQRGGQWYTISRTIWDKLSHITRRMLAGRVPPALLRDLWVDRLYASEPILWCGSITVSQVRMRWNSANNTLASVATWSCSINDKKRVRSCGSLWNEAPMARRPSIASATQQHANRHQAMAEAVLRVRSQTSRTPTSSSSASLRVVRSTATGSRIWRHSCTGT